MVSRISPDMKWETTAFLKSTLSLLPKLRKTLLDFTSCLQYCLHRRTRPNTASAGQRKILGNFLSPMKYKASKQNYCQTSFLWYGQLWSWWGLVIAADSSLVLAPKAGFGSVVRCASLSGCFGVNSLTILKFHDLLKLLLRLTLKLTKLCGGDSLSTFGEVFSGQCSSEWILMLLIFFTVFLQVKIS